MYYDAVRYMIMIEFFMEESFLYHFFIKLRFIIHGKLYVKLLRTHLEFFRKFEVNRTWKVKLYIFGTIKNILSELCNGNRIKRAIEKGSAEEQTVDQRFLSLGAQGWNNGADGDGGTGSLWIYVLYIYGISSRRATNLSEDLQ